MSDVKLTLEPELETPAPGIPTLMLDGVEEEKPVAPEKKEEEQPEVQLTPEEQKVVDDFAEKIDITSSALVMQYGSGAQKKIANFSDTALANVRTKDLGEVGDEIADQFIKRFPLTKTKTRFGGAGIDIAEAAMIDLAFAGVHQVVDSMPRVHAATQYLEEDPELAELCRTDGEGPAELAERIDNISHSMCTLENPLWYSHRRAALANKTHEGRLLALIVRD